MAIELKPLEDLIAIADNEFEKYFGFRATHRSYAPGRVNIIGEHTDYNDGFVLPMAIPLYTVVVGHPKNSDQPCTVFTLNKEFSTENKCEFPNKLNPQKRELDAPKWAHYIMGVVAEFRSISIPFDAVVLSSVPVGAGLSSSAALEVAFYTFLESINSDVKVTPRDKALACQEAEHVYAGVPCGIMDQFVSVMAQSLHALFIDCRDMSTELVSMRNPAVKVFITDSGVRHELCNGEYAIRRQQCEKAIEILGINLRDCSLEILESKKALMDDVIYRRAHHVITENARVKAAVEALIVSDYVYVGQLMQDSHVSLRDNYEVSCVEVDSLVNVANATEGVYGSRMTGGGFGGCTITLIKENAVDRLIDALTEKFGKELKFYVCNACAGGSQFIPV